MFDWSILLPVKHRSKYREFEVMLPNEQGNKLECSEGELLYKPQENRKKFLSLIAVLCAPGLSTPGRVAEPQHPCEKSKWLENGSEEGCLGNTMEGIGEDSVSECHRCMPPSTSLLPSRRMMPMPRALYFMGC